MKITCKNSVSKFTLLELMLAVVMLLVLITMVTAVGNSILGSCERLAAKKRRFKEVLKLDAALDNMLANVVPFHWKVEEGEEPSLIFRGQSDQVEFVYTHRLNRPEDGTLRFARLSVVDETLTVRYQARPLPDPDYPEPLNRTVLAENVDHIEIMYADWTQEGGIEWREQWNLEDQRRQVPLAVVMWIYWQDGRWECWLRRTAGNGFRQRWGKGHQKNELTE